MSVGLIGRKLGMTQVFDEQGHALGVSVIQAGPCHVTQVRTEATDGYSAVQLGFNPVPERKLTRAERGHLGRMPLYRVLREFRTQDADDLSVGDELTVANVDLGQRVDVIGVSKGKGFAGVMKRHGFRGGKRTHGQSDRERAPGSIGAGTSPSRVFKGTRMAGRMGGGRMTARNLSVAKVDVERGLVLVVGAVPGPRDTVVTIRPVRRSGQGAY
ncbi:MAG: 50S ribosomal protein L3 [Chloroflexi bacterium]|nr:50S ribosomal protein L3 [Chloroflexota bacterium]